MRVQYSQGEVGLNDFIVYLNLSEQALPLFGRFIALKEAAKQAKAMGYRPTDEELQACADNLRTALGLHDAQDTVDYLSRSGMTVDDFEDYCESILLAKSFQEHLADEAQIETYFINNRVRFERARISAAVLKDENLANEIKLLVTEDGEDFHALARRHSLDEVTRPAGGYSGLIPREGLRADLAAKIFNASSGDLLGPFSDNGLYQLILVHEVIRPELDDRLKGAISDHIFQEWSARFLREGVVFKPE